MAQPPEELSTLKEHIRSALQLSEKLGLLVVAARLSEALGEVGADGAGNCGSVPGPMGD